MKNIYLFCLLFGFGIFVLPVALDAAEQSESLINNLSNELLHEFANAYPEKAQSTATIKTFEVVAKEDDWAVIPPYKTSVWAYNETVPGPVLRTKLGDTIQVKFTNHLPQATTIHWHGVRVPNAMDGVPGVTQAPVRSGESFTYQFTPKDAGTFWFHPHVNAAEQVERGLHGILIVEDPGEPEYSQDLVWVLDDWLLEKGGQLYEHFVTRHDLAHDGRWGNLMTVNGKYQPTFKVKAGERIRIRMINVANGRVFSPLLEKLEPYVIAVDGMLVQSPFALERFFIAPGNRLDLDIVIPKNAAGKSYVLQDVFSRQKSNLAFLQVSSEQSVVTPTFKAPQARHFPMWLDAIRVPVKHEFILDAKRGGKHGISWMIDNKAWPDTQAFELVAGKFTRLRFNNISPRLHPMHLHGQFFKVIAVNGKSVEENFWRDTVLIGPRESVDIGLIPLDKGLWANHCHILEHAESGMMSTIQVK